MSKIKYQKLTIFLTFITLFLISSSSVYAARTLSITSNKTSLFGDEEMALTASISGFTNGESIYIKGAFYQEGLTKYFGFTRNNDSWVKNGKTTTNQRSVKIGEWDGNVIVKSDFADNRYKGEGEYKFKVGFYYTTSGGNLSSVNWSSNNLAIHLNNPDPTPTNTPIPSLIPSVKPTQSNTPTNTPPPSATVKPQSTSTPIKLVSTVTKIPSLTVTSVQSATSFVSSPFLTSASESAVLGETTNNETNNEKKDSKNTNTFSILLITVGSICVGIACILSYRQIKKSRMNS